MRIEKRAPGVRAFIQAARRAGRSVGLVPTMGALHEGHEALIRRSCGDNDSTVVSVFVNPIQFVANEDLAAYPRDLEADGLMAQRLGVDLVFAPDVDEMYPEGFSTTVVVDQVSAGLCGHFRPGHFRGVATVVCKLLNIVQPDRAYFGEKDYQQLQVVRRMVRDLDMPMIVVPVPTVREADGLAMSSRNAYLSAPERQVAPLLQQALQAGAKVVAAGGTGAEGVVAARAVLATEPLIRVQYLEAVDPQTLEDASGRGRPLVLVAAAHLGKTRLIDNIIINGENK